MAYLEQPYYVGLLGAASLHGAAHQQPQQFQVVTTTPQREVRKKGLAIRFFSRRTSMRPRLLKSKFKRGIFPSLHQRPLQLISSVMRGQLVDWIEQ